MAKKAAPKRKAAAAAATATETRGPEILAPQTVHELFTLPGPYDPPGPPAAPTGFATWWDCGLSINDLRRRRKDLFSSPDWLDGQRFANVSDSWTWRLLNLTPVGPGETFEDQAAAIGRDGVPPTARELVTYLVLHVLATGERLEIPRFRCRDVLPSGRRVCVGPFRDDGLEIANVSDRWMSPGIALCASITPPVRRKK